MKLGCRPWRPFPVPPAILLVVCLLASLPIRSEPAAVLSRLTPCGEALCRSDGSRFRWRGVTAFALLDLMAGGRAAEAHAYLRWARTTGFTIVRVLAMNPGGWFDLSPAAGLRALPDLLAAAREQGMYVQIVALANTVGRDEPFLLSQVRAVGAICGAADNCVMEIANEPYHRSQARLNDPALMRRLQQEIPEGVLVAWGAAPSDTADSMAGGNYVVVHVARSGERWTRVSRVGNLASLSRQTGRFVVDSEPIGAAERAEPDRRDHDPAVFFAQGALSRVLEIGSTFHCEDCLRARLPGPNQQAAAEAFVAGATVAPDDIVLTVIDPLAPDSPVRKDALDVEHRRGFAGVAGPRGWLVLIGPPGPAVPWQAGARPGARIARRPGVEVWTFTR